MKEIQLNRGKVALIDDEDFDQISRYKWFAKRQKYTWYAVRLTDRRRMHTEIMGRLGVDHKNRNGLDNRRENLRFATYSQNNANRGLRLDNSSSFSGVDWHKPTQKWRARIKLDSREIYLGVFTDKITAAHARRQAELNYFGAFAP